MNRRCFRVFVLGIACLLVAGALAAQNPKPVPAPRVTTGQLSPGFPDEPIRIQTDEIKKLVEESVAKAKAIAKIETDFQVDEDLFRLQAEMAKRASEAGWQAAEFAKQAAEFKVATNLGDLAFQFQPPIMRLPRDPREGSVDRRYEQGQRSLDERKYEEALKIFTEVALRPGPRADAALYWKAYAQNRLGQRAEALATLTELEKAHPSSRWLNDAKALQVEVRAAQGQPVTPEAETDEDLKLMAINSLMHSDPERAVPLLEKLLQSSQSRKLRERALFVLAQNNSPKARAVVIQTAKGGANPDLQIKAIRYMGTAGLRKELGEVYASASDPTVKRAVLQGFMMTGAADELLQAAKSETAPELRREAIRQIGAMGARRTGDALITLYGSETEAANKKELINALHIQGNAKALVDIARKETNIDLKKSAVERLSTMKSKEATEYMLELLK